MSVTMYWVVREGQGQIGLAGAGQIKLIVMVRGICKRCLDQATRELLDPVIVQY